MLVSAHRDMYTSGGVPTSPPLHLRHLILMQFLSLTSKLIFMRIM